MADEGLCFMQPRCSEIQTAAGDVSVTSVRLVFDRMRAEAISVLAAGRRVLPCYFCR